jgi:nicotinamidase-related amidase
MSVGLLLIDIQNDYFPGGRMELEGSEEAGRVAGRLVEFFRRQRLPIVHVQHLSVRPGATFFIPDTPGVEIHRGVAPAGGEVVIQKHYPNSFRETELLSHLRQTKLRRLVVAGMMTHMCVDATVRAATDLGYECLVVRDGCATRAVKLDDRPVSAPDVQAAFLAALHGAYGRVLSGDGVLEELQTTPA